MVGVSRRVALPLSPLLGSMWLEKGFRRWLKAFMGKGCVEVQRTFETWRKRGEKECIKSAEVGHEQALLHKWGLSFLESFYRWKFKQAHLHILIKDFMFVHWFINLVDVYRASPMCPQLLKCQQPHSEQARPDPCPGEAFAAVTEIIHRREYNVRKWWVLSIKLKTHEETRLYFR